MLPELERLAAAVARVLATVSELRRFLYGKLPQTLAHAQHRVQAWEANIVEDCQHNRIRELLQTCQIREDDLSRFDPLGLLHPWRHDTVRRTGGEDRMLECLPFWVGLTACLSSIA